MDNCVFCKVIKGELPSNKVYEDELFFGILDINPVARGHALLLPKIHYRWTYDVPQFGQYFETARKLGLAVQKAVGATWVQFFTHGQVPHAHIHITPRSDDVTTAPFLAKWEEPKQLMKREFEEIAEKIRKAL